MIPELAQWDSFYMIVGSAAGALIGLQFVVMALIAERPPAHAMAAGAAFASPTIVHFGTALFLAMLLHAPWRMIAIAAVVASLMGFCGVIYTIIISRRMRRQRAYEPGLEDWAFRAVLPLAAYAVLTLSSGAVLWRTYESLFGVGTAVMLLLFVGIHNAWDNISYHVLVGRYREPGPSGDKTTEKGPGVGH